MTIQEKRNSLYEETLQEMKGEYEEVKEEYEKLRVREFLLRRTISFIKHLLEKPEECTFHLLDQVVNEPGKASRKSK